LRVTASLHDIQHKGDVANKPVTFLVVSLGKALNEMPSYFLSCQTGSSLARRPKRSLGFSWL